jgi:hypothetical protein
MQKKEKKKKKKNEKHRVPEFAKDGTLIANCNIATLKTFMPKKCSLNEMK